jgi:hypothetical protein
MTVLLVVLTLIVVAALALAVELLRSEPVLEQGLADLTQALAPGRDYEPMVRLFEGRDCVLDGVAGLPQDRGRAIRMHLKRLRGDFLTAWAVCRLLAPIGQEPAPMRKLFRHWLSFHWLFVRVWTATYTGQGGQVVSQVQRLVTASGVLRQWAGALMRLDAGVSAGGAGRIRI